MSHDDTLSLADRKREQIIEAATDVFLRYGHARATMGDIAQSAGISRPALYLVYPRKDDVFAAVIMRMNDRMLAELRAALPNLPDLSAKLHHCCGRWGAHGFDLVDAHPDARDLFNLAFPPVRGIFAEFEAFLAEILAESISASRLDATPRSLAQILVFSMRGFKEIAQNGIDMRRMIALEVDVIVAALTAPP